MQKATSLQDHFLRIAKQEQLHVTMFLVNGYQMRGHVAGYDPFVVILTTEGRQQVIYKHAISTIIPERPVPLENASS